MYISTIQIKNFKKLKNVSIPLNEDQSIFVGANNSGKTSAFEAISKFLKKDNNGRRKFSIYDFTIYNWKHINDLLNELQYIKNALSGEEDEQPLLEEYNQKQKELEDLFPSLKIVIDIEPEELYRVIDLIPRLDSNIRQVAVYQRFEPINYEELFEKYKDACDNADKMREVLHGLYSNGNENIDGLKKSIWPENFRDFLEKDGNLHRFFSIRYYLANPGLVEEEEFPHDEANEYNFNPLTNIIEINEINAQRGLTDDEDDSEFKVNKRISGQFSRHHNRFHKSSDEPLDHDGELVYAKYNAEQTIGRNLKNSLTDLIEPLEMLGYPAFGSPYIDVEPVIDIIKTIENEGNILFNPFSVQSKDFLLPERSNGLGFQNLIFIFLKLQYFHHSRLDVDNKQEIKPIHIILIEEPEAHLHAQAQKVFINKAQEVIRKEEPEALHSQLILTTHSSHIANESEFKNLVYFKRKLDEKYQTADVIHLSNVHIDPRHNYNRSVKNDNGDSQKWRNEIASERFVKKYLEVAEHDLFFADGIILVEGSAERILLPEMMKRTFPYLSTKYITFFEVGGAYGHLFLPWLRALGRPTLIITDIDTVDADSKRSKIYTTTEDNKITANPIINEWYKNNNLSIKELFDYTDEDKESYGMRIAYQFLNHGTDNNDAYSRTFEDDLALTNMVLFENMESTRGITKQYKNLFNEASTIDESLTEKLFKETSSDKTTFALDLLYNEVLQNSKINIPKYIEEGFLWLEEQLKQENNERGEESET